METSSNASNIDARQRAAGRSAFTKKELLSGGLPVDWHSFKPQAKSAHQTGTHHGGTYDDNLVEGRKAFPSPGSNLESHYLLGSQRLGRFRQRLQAVAHKRKARPDRRHIVLGPGVGSYRSRETYSNDVILVDGTGKIMSGATESETGDTNASSARPPQKITEYSLTIEPQAQSTPISRVGSVSGMKGQPNVVKDVSLLSMRTSMARAP